MSSVKKPHNWLCVAAFAAAFWITFRVMAAPATPPAPVHPIATGATAEEEVRDPVLDEMIARFANAARASAR